MKKHTNATLILLAIIVLSFVAFSLLTALHVHTCMGEDCPVCQLIDNVRRILGIFAVVYLSYVAVSNALLVGDKTALCNKNFESLVLQKVKIIS